MLNKKGKNEHRWQFSEKEVIQSSATNNLHAFLPGEGFSTQFISVPWLIGSSRGQEGPYSRDLLQAFSAGGPCEQFWHGQGCPLFDVVHPAFPLLTTASPTLQGSLTMILERPSWHVTCLNYASFCSSQLPDEVPVDPQGSWSCSTPSRWPCAPSRRYGEAFSCTWFWKPQEGFATSNDKTCSFKIVTAKMSNVYLTSSLVPFLSRRDNASQNWSLVRLSLLSYPFPFTSWLIIMKFKNYSVSLSILP